jgi:hypothetical protein
LGELGDAGGWGGHWDCGLRNSDCGLGG